MAAGKPGMADNKNILAESKHSVAFIKNIVGILFHKAGIEKKITPDERYFAKKADRLTFDRENLAAALPETRIELVDTPGKEKILGR